MNYLNENLCAICKGVCCKRMPGATMPQDIQNLFPADNMQESLFLAFQTVKWVIDCWDGDPRDGMDELSQAYYIRPKNDDIRHRGLYSFSWGGHCIFLNDSGCELEPESRPYNCRMLEPKPNQECILHDGNKQTCSIAWIEYTADIKRAAQRFLDQNC